METIQAFFTMNEQERHEPANDTAEAPSAAFSAELAALQARVKALENSLYDLEDRLIAAEQIRAVMQSLPPLNQHRSDDWAEMLSLVIRRSDDNETVKMPQRLHPRMKKTVPFGGWTWHILFQNKKEAPAL